MEMSLQILSSVLVSALLLSAGFVDALSYDYSATTKCLDEPTRPLYGGGMIQNPEFHDGLKGWSVFGDGKIEQREAKDGNKFGVSHSRQNPHDSLSQRLTLEKTKMYTLSAWVQVSDGSVPVIAVFKTNSDFIHAGHVIAKSGCWSMLKGGVTVDVTGPAELYFEQTQNRTDVEIWLDSVSLQPFTQEEWRSHQTEMEEKVRKRKVKFHVKDGNGNPQQGVTISMWQRSSGFPLGCAISRQILTNNAYQSWYTSRGFTVATFENEMKWYATEPSQGKEGYSVPDAMLAFAKKNGISVRGHNVFWDDPRTQTQWVESLSSDALQAAADRRITSIMSRYKGKVIAWDVVNENLHFSYFEDNLGGDASSKFYRRASQLDPGTLLFMNEYNTLEAPNDTSSTPEKYLAKIEDISNSVDRGRLAIGLQGHFSTPNIPYIRSALDTLAEANLPIWLTEVDVKSGPKQAEYLEQILRELHGHRAVKGIVIWGAWRPEGCYAMCLTDNDFKNLPTGDVVDKLLGEWRTSSSSETHGKTDCGGFFEAVLSHGDYNLTVVNPSGNYSSAMNFRVAPEVESLVELRLV